MKYFFVLTFAIFLLFNASNAHAYIDPGTGSFLLQALIAAVIGFMFAIKNIFTTPFKTILRAVRKLFPSESKSIMSAMDSGDGDEGIPSKNALKTEANRTPTKPKNPSADRI
jgi:hypothetical protein